MVVAASSYARAGVAGTAVRGKGGLSATPILLVLAKLKTRGMLNCPQLLCLCSSTMKIGTTTTSTTLGDGRQKRLIA
jgi:hypothetical protein